MARARIGTAGWSVPREHAAAFSEDGSHLERYARVLDAVEINSTFYRRHRAATFERWRDVVPADFRFSVKMPKTITHESALRSPRALLGEFFADIAGLGPKLGVVLVQLAASLPYETRRARAFWTAVRDSYEGPVAFEPRHPSWYEPNVQALLVDHDVALVAADPPRPALARLPGGSASLVYWRWHGSPRTYWSSYDDARLAELAKSVAALPPKKNVWCIFDNTASGAAAGDALRLKALTTKPARDRTTN